jgi:hypothetical protein
MNPIGLVAQVCLLGDNESVGQEPFPFPCFGGHGRESSCLIPPRGSPSAGLIWCCRGSRVNTTHNLEELLVLSGAKVEFDADSAVDPDLFSNWGIVVEWTEASRYERKTKAEAEDLYEAITDKKHGVLQWIKRRW